MVSPQIRRSATKYRLWATRSRMEILILFLPEANENYKKLRWNPIICLIAINEFCAVLRRRAICSNRRGMVTVFLLLSGFINRHFHRNSTTFNFTTIHLLDSLLLRSFVVKCYKAKPTTLSSLSTFSKFPDDKSRDLTRDNVSGCWVVCRKEFL
jgi:hypothetical protein